MVTAYAIHSLRNTLVAVALLISVTTACKKSGLGGADIDPRDQYVGVYEGGYTASTLVNNSLVSNRETGTMKITVTKSEVAKQLYLDLLFNGVTNQKVTAELSDNTAFTIIDKQSDTIPFDGRNYQGNYTATGQFVDKVVTLNTVTETLQSSVTLSRRGDITGTKK